MKLTEPVVITPRGVGADAFGTRTEGVVTGDPVIAYGYLDEQAGSEEAGPDGQAVTWDALLFLRAGTAITAADSLTVRGGRWQVIGPPVRPRRPGATREHHVEVRLGRNTDDEG